LHRPTLPVGVAYSGGADSTALLLAAQARWPGQCVALHVHHGLQAAADDFALHCARWCGQRGVALETRRVDARHQPGESPEDAARQARYRELAAMARQHGLHQVLLAQHADDQAETLLLALGRGAGLPGLAAMPARFERHGMVFCRPILAARAPAIRTWLAAQGVDFVTDPSNADTGFTRNRLRAHLLPALESVFPHFRTALARSARHAAQAQSLVTELAVADLGPDLGPLLPLVLLQSLPPPRQTNALRHWLKTCHGVSPSTAQLDALLPQIAACLTRGHSIRLKVASGMVQRQGAHLAYLADTSTL